MNPAQTHTSAGKQTHFIIFKNQKLIYARVPKVANSSVKTALTSLVTINKTDGLKPTNDKFWNRCTNDETNIVNAHHATKLKDSFFSFTFVREPLDRLVSCYVNKIIVNPTLNEGFLKRGYLKSMSFDDFVAHTCEIPDESMDVHVRPQSSMVLFSDGTSPTFIGKYESLDLHWAALVEELKKRGLKDLGELPKINARKGQRDQVDLALSQHTRARFLEKYQRDYQLFYADAA